MAGLKHYRMLIDGQWVDAEDGKTFKSVNPATGVAWAEIPEASEADVNRAVEAAHRAFTDGPWSKTMPSERGRYLRKLADLLADRSEDLGRTETIDTGKMLKETRWQAKYVAEFFHYNAGLADKIHGDTMPIDKPDLCVFTTREPLGVVAAVVPWNSQLFLVAVKIGPALAAGNTVVLKASEHASGAMLEFGKLIEEAGFPQGVVNIVTGYGEPCGRALTSHPLVARVSFTGGPETARHIVRNSAENFAQVSLELGGKSPVMVFEDADQESAVNGVMAGIFGASGQSCVAGSRLYLQEPIADGFLDKLVGRAKQIKIGDPLAEETQMGPLATEAQLTRIEAEVDKAQAQGAKLL
ncbi:MAG: aldehyde dehydrogenase family protein, partial [Kiloniellales bacterium]